MPTTLRKNGFRFFFYSREGNEPAHVHVIGRGGEMKGWLDPIEIVAVYKLAAKDQREVLKITKENVKLLLNSWKDWHESNSEKN